MDGSNSLIEEIRGVDWLFWIYNSITLIFLIMMGREVNHRWLFALSNLALIFTSLLLIRFRINGFSTGFIDLLRNGYPYLYFFYLHWESGMIRYLFHSHSFDAIVQRWDLAVFGVHLNDILANFQPVWFSELISFSYFFYYLLMLLPFFLYRQNNNQKFRQFIFDISLLYLIHYFIFYLFPVLGPIQHHYEVFHDGVLFEPLMRMIYTLGDSPGGAMPSSHVAIAVLSLCWLFHGKKKVAWLVTPLLICLIFSTVYLSYHYAIDAVVGLADALLFYFVMQWLRIRFPKMAFT